MRLVASEENPRAVDGRCDAYWFSRPHGPNKAPADCCEQQVIPAVNEGALAVFVFCWDIPLEQGWHCARRSSTLVALPAISFR